MNATKAGFGASSMIVVVWCLSWPGMARAGLFQGLGDLDGGDYASQAWGISASGSHVVGASSCEWGPWAFRWTRSRGMEKLDKGFDPIAGTSFNIASAVSADGSVATGQGWWCIRHAIRYTVWGGEFLGLLLPCPSWGCGISADGSVVVGCCTSALGVEAFRFTSVTSRAEGLGDLEGGPFGSEARGVSADGWVIAGYGTSASGREAFRWTPETGIVGLGDLPGGMFHSEAMAISGDASAIVGFGRSARGQEAFRWTAAKGMVPLGDLPGGEFYSVANAVSEDGSVIVGQGSSLAGLEAFVLREWFPWDGGHGIRSLRDMILEWDPNSRVRGWTLTEATGVSGDGNTICGTGINEQGLTEAWIVWLPRPGDTNRDGDVDFYDYLTVKANFGRTGDVSWPDGDFDEDGDVDFFDYLTAKENFGWDPAGDSQPVPGPAPSGMLLFLWGAAGLVRRRAA